MKTFVALLLAAIPACAQNKTRDAPACGLNAVKYSVTIGDTNGGPNTAVPQNKARAIFIQDDGSGGNHQLSTVVIGLDGAWVGAYKKNSWFMIDVDPGTHHICARVQVKSLQAVALDEFDAETGKVYYFRTRYLAGLRTMYALYPYLMLDRPNRDEVAYLLGISPVSKGVPNK